MRYCLIAAALLSFACLPGHATPVTYTLSFVTDGSIGTTTFSDQPITVTATGDTSTLILSNPAHGGAYSETLTSLTITVGNVTAVVSGPLSFLYTTQVDDVALSGGGGFLSAIYCCSSIDNLLQNYSGRSSLQYLGNSTFSTDLGSVALTTSPPPADLQNNPITFTTTLGATPEPSSIALLGTGLFGLAGVVKRRLA